MFKLNQRFLYLEGLFYSIPKDLDLLAGNEDIGNKTLSLLKNKGYFGSFPLNCDDCYNQPTLNSKCSSNKKEIFEIYTNKKDFIKFPVECFVLDEFYKMLKNEGRLDKYLLDINPEDNLIKKIKTNMTKRKLEHIISEKPMLVF